MLVPVAPVVLDEAAAVVVVVVSAAEVVVVVSASSGAGVAVSAVRAWRVAGESRSLWWRRNLAGPRML